MKHVITTALILVSSFLEAGITQEATFTTIRQPVKEEVVTKDREESFVRPPSLEQVQPVKEREVLVYIADWCPNCKPAIAELKKKAPWIEVGTFDIDNRTPPVKLDYIPAFHFKDDSGKWKVLQGGQYVNDVIRLLPEPKSTSTLVSYENPEAQPTPWDKVREIVDTLPLNKDKVFGDIGCGRDARVSVAVALKYGCRCLAIELDSYRAEQAKETVRRLGLDHLITVIEADATEYPFQVDVGYAYLFPEVLQKLAPKIRATEYFVSYQHQIPGLYLEDMGEWFVWNKTNQYQPSSQYSSNQNGVYWNGGYYTGRVCSSPNCSMCNAIARLLRKK